MGHLRRGGRKANGDRRIDFQALPTSGDNPIEGSISPAGGNAMRVRCHAQGKFYTIECPEGTRVVRRPKPVDGADPHDLLIVPLNGKVVRIPADPPELLPLLAETGNFGVSLVGEARADVGWRVRMPRLWRGGRDWLQLGEESEAVHCDRLRGRFRVAECRPPSP